nr:hypothetical protein [Tanacetum cinerariifolium]
MLGSEYGEQDRKAAVLYEYETFKATEGELLHGTYIRYLQVINDLKKCGYSKDNCELNFKFLNNLQPEWKQYATMMRQNKNLMDINIDALYNIPKQNQGDVNDDMGSKKKTVVLTSDPLALIAEKTKVSKSKEKVVVSLDSKGSEADDFGELKKIIALLAKAFNQRKFYSKPTNNNLRTSSSSQSVNKKREFVKTENKKVEKKDDEKKRDMRESNVITTRREDISQKIERKSKSRIMKASSSSADEKIFEKRVEKANQQSKDFENQNKDLQDKYDVLKNQETIFKMNNKELNEQLKELIEMNNDLLAQTKYVKMMRHNKNLMDINIDALYTILKQNQGDVNDKTVVVTFDPLALIAKNTNVSRSKEKVVVSSDSEGSEPDDFSELKKITA